MDVTVHARVAAYGLARGVFATKGYRLVLIGPIIGATAPHKMPSTNGWHADSCGYEPVLFDTFFAVVRIRMGA